MIKENNIQKQIDKAIEEKWQVCVYGLGNLGMKLYEEVPGIFNLHANLFSDGNDDKVNNTTIEGMKGIFLKDLLESSKDILVFVLVDNPYDSQIEEKLSINSKLHVCTLRKLTKLEKVFEYYYGAKMLSDYQKLPVWKG